jgi:hypothetical protein
MENKMSDFKVLLELAEKDGKIYSKTINKFTVNPMIASGMCYVIFNTLIDCIPEDKQIDFENLFMANLEEMMRMGHNYMTYYNE